MKYHYTVALLYSSTAFAHPSATFALSWACIPNSSLIALIALTNDKDRHIHFELGGLVVTDFRNATRTYDPIVHSHIT